MAGRIPQSFINDLLDRVDIVEVIDARVKLKKAGKNYQARCPFHNEKTPSFSVSPDKQFYHCFGCQESGTALTFLLEHDRMDFVEAVETLAAMVGLEVPREQGQRDNTRQLSLYDLLKQAAQRYQRSLRASEVAIAYLKDRGLTGLVAKDFGIGYAPDAWDTLLTEFRGRSAELLEAGLVIKNEKGRTYDRFRDRIMFPIRDTRGRVIGFGGRVLGGDGGPKYLNSPETPVFHKGRELYGLYEARRAVRKLSRFVVVEGYMDVVALAQHGVPYAVATLGTATSDTHFTKLFRYASEVICCFDGDAAGRQAAWRALESALPTLEDGRQLKFMFLPDGEDPDTIVRSQGQAAFEARLDEAITATEYLFNQLMGGLDLKTMEGRARLSNLAQPHIARLPGGVLKSLMSQRLQTLTGLQAARAQPGVRSSATVAGSPKAVEVSRGQKRLTERLVTLLMQDLPLYGNITDENRAKIATFPTEDLFAQIVRYMDQNPNAGIGEILGAWAGEPEHQLLVNVLKRPLELDAKAIAAEFADGVKRLIELADRQQRRRLLKEVQQTPTKETYLRYVSQKQDSSDDG
ncbi:MAG: DNA primase [Pseudomonadales bacterium]